jgi:hypothetical protein
MRRNDFTHFYALEKKGTGHCFTHTHTHGAKFLNPARFKARVPGFDRVGRVNFYFKKFQKDVVLVKKKNKSQRVATGFLTGSAGSYRVMAYAIFSSTRPGSSPGSAGSRVDPPGRAGFQNTDAELA